MKRGRRSAAECEAEPAIWFAGAWRSPAGIEEVRRRLRERERARRRARRKSETGNVLVELAIGYAGVMLGAALLAQSGDRSGLMALLSGVAGMAVLLGGVVVATRGPRRW